MVCCLSSGKILVKQVKSLLLSLLDQMELYYFYFLLYRVTPSRFLVQKSYSRLGLVYLGLVSCPTNITSAVYVGST